jgi:hypothetical protein
MGMAITKELPAKNNPAAHTGALYLSFSKNPSTPTETTIPSTRSWWSGSFLYLKFFSNTFFNN